MVEGEYHQLKEKREHGSDRGKWALEPAPAFETVAITLIVPVDFGMMSCFILLFPTKLAGITHLG